MDAAGTVPSEPPPRSPRPTPPRRGPWLRTVLYAIALLHAIGLALAVWLGITDLPPPRVASAAPELLISGTDLDEAQLRAGLRLAGMPDDVALHRRFDTWPPSAAESVNQAATALSGGDLALVIAAEDSRSLDRLPAALQLGRSAGGPVLLASLPDRGWMTQAFAWPLLRRRIDAAMEAGRHASIGTVIREHAGRITVIVLLAGPDRGMRAATIPRPRLQAPIIPPGS